MVAPVIKQSWVALAALINHLGNGIILSYSSSLLPPLMAEDSPIKVDLSTASWLASSVGIGMLLGDVAAIYSLRKLGRKWSHALAIPVAILGWALIYLATNITTLMIGRVLTGYGVSTTYVIGCCVISEYTAPEVRGILFSLKTSSFAIGSFGLHFLGTYYSWRTVAAASTIPLLVSLAITLTWPESPAWLLLQGDYKRSEETFYWLRGTSERTVKEFQAMVQAQRERDQNATKRKNLKENLIHYRNLLQKKEFMKPLVISFFAMLCMESSGRHYIPSFSTTIMAEILPDANLTDSSVFILSFDVIALVGGGVLCTLVKRFSRRTILFLSGSVSVVTLWSFSLYGYLIHTGVVTNRPWVIMTMLISFIVLSNIGIITVPLVVIGEIFPVAFREFSTSLSAAFSAIILFVILKLTLLLIASITLYGAFAVFSVLLLLSLLYLYYNLPETRNKTMQEIEDYFKHGKFVERQFKNEFGPEKEAMLSSKP
ncbi:facilitated trehalose transporter Tret1 [Plutella xylostella]|uniref:facilitated trehalose transporter Tret1 n=1 Tax=Plutella xylostella TaxID=51655 RepID=UPI002032F110|nr:facilitated trehalose transporter Tret1 [Plutella xylostella]